MNFNLIAPVNIGELNEIKINKLQEKFSKRFKNGIVNPGQLIMMSQNSQVILQSNQIQYVFTDEEVDSVEKTLKDIQELLLLNERFDSMVLVISELRECGKSTMELSKVKFKNLLKDSIGVGIREFFSYNNSLCEIKVEPCISDDQMWYQEVQYNMKSVDISSIKNVIESVKDDYTIKCKEIYENIN